MSKVFVFDNTRQFIKTNIASFSVQRQQMALVVTAFVRWKHFEYLIIKNMFSLNIRVLYAIRTQKLYLTFEYDNWSREKYNTKNSLNKIQIK